MACVRISKLSSETGSLVHFSKADKTGGDRMEDVLPPTQTECYTLPNKRCALGLPEPCVLHALPAGESDHRVLFSHSQRAVWSVV